MEENFKLEISEADIEKTAKKAKKLKKDEKPSKKWLIFLISGIVFLLAGVGLILFSVLKPEVKQEALHFPKIPSESKSEQIYSDLTGEPLADASLKTAPAFCIQTPNGLDGARPQVGLTTAGVIFEAIAEAGITRFAAIYQNPTQAVIGPIRSLRIYYLDWDTPFDCTIVHAGGAQNAIDAVRAGGYRDLTENYNYMYRGTAGARLWNNLFTTATELKQFNADYGYNSSEIKGFPRMNPEEAKIERVNKLASDKLVITEASEKNTSELVAEADNISLSFGSFPAFNVNYTYNADSNTYFRSYGDGVAHEVYECPNDNLGEVNPESACQLTQMNPSVVIAMVVQERRAPDNYYEAITTIGSGNVYIFQNGAVYTGTWNKSSREEQIKFSDSDGNEIRLVPGQTIISAVPNYGNVEY